MKKRRRLNGIISKLRRGTLQFSLGWPPISYSYPLTQTHQTEIRRKKTSARPKLTPIQREALPMIRAKLEEAKRLGQNDKVLYYAAIEYAVENPRKAQRTLEEILSSL